MLRFHAAYVLMISDEMHKFSNLEFERVRIDWNNPWLIERLESLISHTKELGLPVSTAAAERFLTLVRRHEIAQANEKRLQSGGVKSWFNWNKPSVVQNPLLRLVKPKEFIEHARMLNAAFKDELSGMHIFAIPFDRVRYYEQKEPIFGDVVAKKFPSLLDEVEEAGKCYALGRSTASVFHSLRCLEAGIAAMSRCLGIPDPTKGSERSWMKLLNAIEKEMDKRWLKAQARFSGDGKAFEELYAVLAAIQNPYRNSTMHLDAKYTAEQALDIMNAVRRFMITVANRMDEYGDPRA
jgi:hypothetical protein